MNLRKQQAIETYNHILATAEALAENSTYESLSVDQICECAGISKGGFYHHFSSKDQLIALLFGCRLDKQLNERVEPCLGKENAFTLLKIYVDTMVEFLKNNPRDTVIRCWLMLTEHVEVTDPSFSRESFQILHAIVAQGKAEGSIRPELDDDFCQAFINGALTGIIMYGSTFGNYPSLQQFATNSLELICQALSQK